MERRMTVSTSSSQSAIDLNLPHSRYPVLSMGITQGKSKLENLLESCSIKYDQFIIRCSAVKESTSWQARKKPRLKRPCMLILYKDGFCTKMLDTNKVKHYSYNLVEMI